MVFGKRLTRARIASDPRLWIVAVFLFSSLFLSRVYKTHITLYSVGDDDFYWSYPRRLVYERNLNFENEVLPTFRVAPSARNVASPFPGLLWSPAVVLGKVITPIMAHFPNAKPEDLANGITPYHRLLVSAFSAVLSLGGMLFFFYAFKRFVSAKAAALAVITVFLGTPLLYFTFRRPLMAHSAEFFTLAIFAWMSLRYVTTHTTWMNAFWMGFLGALAVGTRYPNVFVVSSMVLGLLMWERKRMAWKPLMIWPSGIGALIVVLCQLVIWKSVWSSGIPDAGDYSFKLVDLMRHFRINPRTLMRSFEVLFGGWGLLWLEPAVFLAAIGVLRSKSPMKEYGFALTLGFIPLFLITANYWRGTQGGSYAYRYLLGNSPWVILGLSLFLDRIKSHKRALALAITGCLLLPLICLTLFESGPHELTLHQTARDWENNTYAFEVMKTLVSHPQQLFYATMGCPFFHAITVILFKFGFLSGLSGPASDILFVRMAAIPNEQFFWYYAWVFIFSLFPLVWVLRHPESNVDPIPQNAIPR